MFYRRYYGFWTNYRTKTFCKGIYKKDIEQNLIDKINLDIEEYNSLAKFEYSIYNKWAWCFWKKHFSRFGRFKNVNNYIALIGKKCDNLDEKIGYFGEKLVLKAQSLGLNTCWVGGTYSKKNSRYKIEKDEKLICVIAIGYGETNGKVRKLKSVSSVAISDVEMPDWFLRGVKICLACSNCIESAKIYN